MMDKIPLSYLPYAINWLLLESGRLHTDPWFFVLEGARVDELGTHIVSIPNTPNLYNDLLVLIDEGEVQGIYTAACNPGRYWVEKKCAQTKGAATLVHGVWEFKKALHHGRKALRQHTAVRVWRDKGILYLQDVDDVIDDGHHGIDVHDGGTSIYVEKWSAGCTVVHGGRTLGSPWDEFIKQIYAFSNDTFIGVWWSAADLVRWAGSRLVRVPVLPNEYLFGLDFKKAPTLRKGMGGKYNGISKWVEILQARLNQLDTFGEETILIDGDFGPGTTERLISYQADTSLEERGICGPETWCIFG